MLSLLTRGALRGLTVATLALAAMDAGAEARPDRFGAGGYLRIGTRPDFQGGYSSLGYWNLYGRLLNEAPYAALEMRLDVLQPDGDRPWTSLRAKVEGGSVMTADAGRGALSLFRLTQLYVQAGNLLVKDLIWQFGTLDSYLGDLGLYDMRPAQVLFETVGASARYRTRDLDVVVGVGDSGWFLRGPQYNTIFTLGGLARVKPGAHFEFGVGGQLMYEPAVEGNRFAPYATPDVRYEDFVRGEVARRYLEANPTGGDFFPAPVARSSTSGKLVGYLGFGGLGPLMWNSLYANLILGHPEQFRDETWNGRTYRIYAQALTDQRWQLNAGNEARFTVLPGRLDVAWGLLFGYHVDADNTIKPTDDNRLFASTVVRAQAYLTDTLHLLVEGSAAYEESTRGNLYRNRADSIFASTAGRSDTRGLEYGAASVRTTQQLKLGPVLSPLGTGIYTRPTLRLLYGLQHSSQNNAFGNSFVETLDENSQFQTVERHFHHVVALEAEAWF
jgi:hypothetical protein